MFEHPLINSLMKMKNSNNVSVCVCVQILFLSIAQYACSVYISVCSVGHTSPMFMSSKTPSPICNKAKVFYLALYQKIDFANVCFILLFDRISYLLFLFYLFYSFILFY